MKQTTEERLEQIRNFVDGAVATNKAATLRTLEGRVVPRLEKLAKDSRAALEDESLEPSSRAVRILLGFVTAQGFILSDLAGAVSSSHVEMHAMQAIGMLEELVAEIQGDGDEPKEQQHL